MPATASRALAGRQAKVSPQLLGAWSRKITVADWKRVGRPDQYAGPYSIYISADGTLAEAESTIRFSPSPGGHLTFRGLAGCGKTTGLYHWTVVSRRLTLTKLRDTCRLRDGLLADLWTRQ
jgi:hypothetical protein